MSAGPGKRWNRDELILAINLYCRTPFGRIHTANPEIIELAELLGRTPGSVSYKLANFAAIDPSLDRRGAANASVLDRETWEEFFRDWEGMIHESEARLADLRGELLPEISPPSLPAGVERQAIVKARVNQQFFRRMVLSSYDYRCCITGLPIERVLVASHIVPWSIDEANRLNPRNGLCLNALHDRAFDTGLMTVDAQYRVVVSKEVRNVGGDIALLTDYEGECLRMPRRFLPDQKLLEVHRNTVFTG